MLSHCLLCTAKVLALLSSGEGSKVPTPPNATIVLENHGVMLKLVGLITLDSNENLPLVFLKIKTPQLQPIVIG